MRALLGLFAAMAALAVLVAAAAALLLPARLDPARVRAALEHAAAERLGATVAIEGTVSFALLPAPVLVASRVSLLHGVPGDADALAVTAGTLTAHLDLSALARGRFAASDLELDTAEVQAPFPFDVRLLTAGRPASLRSTAISLRRSRIVAGPFAAEEVDARLVADRATGDVTLSGTFRLAGGSAWRGRLQLTRPGGDGSAALDATLDEIYAPDGPSAVLTGQLAGDGGLAGRLTLSGPNLSRVMPGPATPFRAIGRVSVAGGIVAFEDAALTLDGVPSRLDATLHLPPHPRLDVSLLASRLDLDVWRGALTAAVRPLDLPLGLTLSAESATLAGGVLRQLRAEVGLEDDRIAVRSLEAVLPGDMTVQAAGTIDRAAGTSRSEWRADGADLRATAAWLGRLTGAPPPASLPDSMFRTLSLRATIETAGREMEAHDLAGALDGAGLHGDAILSLGPNDAAAPNLAAILTLDRLDASPWVAWWRAGGPASPWPGADVALQIATPLAVFPGLEPASFEADVALRADALELHKVQAVSTNWGARVSGSRAASGRWSDASLVLNADRVLILAPVLPQVWRDFLAGWPELAAQTLHVNVAGSGTVQSPSATIAAEIGGLQVEASPSLDVATGEAHGGVALRHPSATGLADALRLRGFGFLGDGSLAATADAAWDGSAATLRHISVRAGLMQAAGDLRFDLSGPVPQVTGRIDAPALALPAFDPRETAPLPVGLLRGWGGTIDIAARSVEGLGIGLADARARVTLADGALRLSNFSSGLAGGTVTGEMGLDAAHVPPRATADLAFTGLRLPAQPWRPYDLIAADVTGSARLSCVGYAPATLRATLSGEARATLSNASLIGLDVGGLGPNLSDEAVRAALSDGRTVLDSATVALGLDHGLATLDFSALASEGAALDARGTVDLSAATIDVGLDIRPGIADPPRIGVQLSGKAGDATATPVLGDLARWRLSRP